MQELIVGLLVIYAAWSVAARYTPKAIKRNARRLTAGFLGRIGLKAAAVRIGKTHPGTDCASGCGSCGGCGPSPDKDAASRTSAVTPEALRRTARAHKAS